MLQNFSVEIYFQNLNDLYLGGLRNRFYSAFTYGLLKFELREVL